MGTIVEVEGYAGSAVALNRIAAALERIAALAEESAHTLQSIEGHLCANSPNGKTTYGVAAALSYIADAIDSK